MTTRIPPLPKCTIRGTARADVLRGTAKSDVICGLGGNDRIYAGGNDTVVAGSGNDTIYARNGKPDVVFGGPGVDRARFDPQIDLGYGIEHLIP